MKSLDQVKQSSLYMLLTDKQKLWFCHYAVNGNVVEAARCSSPDCRDPNGLGQQFLRNRKIRRLLEYMADEEEKVSGQLTQDEILNKLSASIRLGGREQIQAIKMYAQLKGWLKQAKPDENEHDKITRIARELEEMERHEPNKKDRTQ